MQGQGLTVMWQVAMESSSRKLDLEPRYGSQDVGLGLVISGGVLERI